MGIICGSCGMPLVKPKAIHYSELPIIVYTISSLWIKNPEADGTRTRGLFADENYRNRTVGFYKTLEKAKQCVEEDWPHFDECGYYNYIVIEGLWEGCYPGLGDNEFWYKHDWDNQKWVPCDKPKAMVAVVNFYG